MIDQDPAKDSGQNSEYIIQYIDNDIDISINVDISIFIHFRHPLNTP